MSQVKKIVKIEPLKHDIGNYLRTIACNHPYHRYYNVFIVPLLEKALMMNPDNLFRSLESDSETTICTLVRESSKETTQIDVDFYGNFDELFLTYRTDYGYTSKEKVLEILKEIESPDFSTYLMKSIIETYPEKINEAICIRYDISAMQLVIPINDIFTIEICLTVDPRDERMVSDAIN